MRFHAHCGSILKRSMALLLALVIALPSFAEKGDVNSDGSVNVSDVTALINSILGVQSIDQSLADVNLSLIHI